MDDEGTFLFRDDWFLSPDGRFRRGSARAARGRIVSLEASGPARALPPPGEAFWVPAGIDPHVHFRQPGAAASEGVANGSRAALKGGVAWVCDMPNNRPPITTEARLRRKLALFRRDSRVRFALFADARGDAPLLPGACAYKLFLTDVACEPATVAKLLRARPRVTVHAEDSSLFLDDPSLPHDRRRPRAAVVSALAALEAAYFSLPEAERPSLVLAHATGLAELAFADRMRARGATLFVETAPHYLLFTNQDARRVGATMQVNPPLRSAANRAALWQAVRDGTIDFLGTDHAPHPPARKASATPPSGMPGVEWFLPLVYTFAAAGFLSFRRAMELTALAARRAYGLPASQGIAEGSPADLARLVPAGPVPSAPAPWFLRREGSVDCGPVLTRAGYNPYRAFPFAFSVERTLVSQGDAPCP